MQEIDLLLIGKSRNGKSATGNSIIGKEVFQRNTQSSLVMTPQKLMKESKHHDKYRYTVNIVDGLNIGEFTKTDRGDIERDIASLTGALKKCNNGFSLLLIVIKFGVKFSDEEDDALKLLKSILGDSVLKSYGVLVITHGDNYQTAHESGEFSSFDEWCSGQPAGFQNLVEECNKRYVLFNNRTDSTEVKEHQLDRLFATIKKMHTKRYSIKEFETAKKRHEELKRKKKPQEMEHKTYIVIENVRGQLREIENLKTINVIIQELEKVAKQLEEHRTLVEQSLDIKCKEAKQCSTQISVLHAEILSQIKKMKKNETLPDTLQQNSNTPDESASLYTLERVSTNTKQTVKGSGSVNIEGHKLYEIKSRLRSIKERINDSESAYKEATESYRCQVESFMTDLYILKEDVDQVSNNNSLLSDIETTKLILHQRIQQIPNVTPVSISEKHVKRNKLDDATEVTKRGALGGPPAVKENQASRSGSSVSQWDHPKRCRSLDSDLIGKDVSTSAIFTTRTLPGQQREGTLSKWEHLTRSQSLGSDSNGKDICIPPIFANGHSNHSEDELKDLSLILIGSSGNGRSATGNSILRESVFKTSPMNSAKSADRENIQKETVKFGNTELHVIDGPSIDCSAKDMKEDLENLSKSLEKSLELSGNRLSAILIIVKFGMRFSKQEARSIGLIKRILGNDIIKDFGICVVTHGDNFQSEVKQAKRSGEVMTFQGWCREQEGDLKNLFEECNDRVVLFNNKEKDEGKKEMQVEKLVDMIDKHIWYSKEYTIPQDVDRKTM